MTPAGVYDGGGSPLLNSPALLRWEDVYTGRPACRLLLDLDRNLYWSGGDVDRQWALGPAPLPIAPDVLADLVAVLDSGGRIAVLAPDAETAEAAIGAVLALAGDWRA